MPRKINGTVKNEKFKLYSFELYIKLTENWEDGYFHVSCHLFSPDFVSYMMPVNLLLKRHEVACVA